MDGPGRPRAAHEGRKRGLYLLGQRSIAAVDHVDGAGTLAVDTEVLGERLGDYALNTFASKEPGGVAVVLEAPGGKALVSSVEKGQVFLAFEDGKQLVELFLRQIDSRRVVCAGVNKEDRTVGRCLDILH